MFLKTLWKIYVIVSQSIVFRISRFRSYWIVCNTPKWYLSQKSQSTLAVLSLVNSFIYWIKTWFPTCVAFLAMWRVKCNISLPWHVHTLYSFPFISKAVPDMSVICCVVCIFWNLQNGMKLHQLSFTKKTILIEQTGNLTGGCFCSLAILCQLTRAYSNCSVKTKQNLLVTKV